MRFLFRWVQRYTVPPRWMAYAFYSVSRNQCLYAIFPLNLLIVLAWWINHRWATYANAPSWIERELERRFEAHKTGHYDRYLTRP